MKKHHDITDIKVQNGFLVITIDGEPRQFRLKEISPALEKASAAERNNFEISPSGYGVHWLMLDEDISIDGLLGMVHAPHWKKKEDWLPCSRGCHLKSVCRPTTTHCVQFLN